MDSSTRMYKLADDVLSADTDEETVLFGGESGRYVGVSGALRNLIVELRDGMLFDDMIRDFCGRYELSREDAARDLEEALSKLIALNMVVKSA